MNHDAPIFCTDCFDWHCYNMQCADRQCPSCGINQCLYPDHNAGCEVNDEHEDCHCPICIALEMQATK